jgi:hypothetical protein
MHNSDYYREQADDYRQLAASADDPAAKQELLELAEQAADKMDDTRASGQVGCFSHPQCLLL